MASVVGLLSTRLMSDNNTCDKCGRSLGTCDPEHCMYCYRDDNEAGRVNSFGRKREEWRPGIVRSVRVDGMALVTNSELSFKRTPGTSATCSNCGKQENEHVWSCTNCRRHVKSVPCGCPKQYCVQLPGESCCNKGFTLVCVP